ncbi:MAG TPA: hypothetical protein PKH05_18585, partial [Nitrospira sp.]|nr:hypothetical protein [Nitrospira sp.]
MMVDVGTSNTVSIEPFWRKGVLFDHCTSYPSKSRCDGPTPVQLFGIEKDPFAAELAQVVVWIGYLQWKRANGFFDVEEPVLQALQNIQCRDAILTVDLNGQPAEPEWPEA